MWEERGKTKYMLNVMNVPNLAKNLISVGQIVEQGMQVKFKQSGCFIEKNGKLIAKGKRQGRMFVLDVDMPRKITTMFAEGMNVTLDVEMWHKRIGHISMQTLKKYVEKRCSGWTSKIERL